MKAKQFSGFLAALTAVALLISACSPAANNTKTPDSNQGQQQQNTKVSMTEQGTPRNETLIIDAIDGRMTNPHQWNYLIGGTAMSHGLHQVCKANLYEIDGVKGDMLPIIAAKAPEPLTPDFTVWKVTIRDGLKWSDGDDLTAEDIAYTANVYATNEGLGGYGHWSSVIKEMKVTDKTTVEFHLKKPWPRFDSLVGNQIWDGSFHIIPAHLDGKVDWAKDPMKDGPVCSGMYKLKSVDDNGYWTLWEKREDWKNAAYGHLGEPKPKYILYKFFGPEEKRILAGISHEMDVFTDISPDSWSVLRQKEPTAQAWFDGFPYANMDDPCERGIEINNGRAPYDIQDVRWALALATDIRSVSLSSFSGMLRMSPISMAPLSGLQEVYHFPMEDWLKNFTLSDGYKPFDPDQASKLVASLAGEKGLPTDPKEMKKVFGVGWWKYDPAQATKLLQKHGFKKTADGKWLLPDGKPWKISINAPANFEIQSQKLAYAVADSWKKFGIDATAVDMEAGPFWAARDNGEFEIGSYWVTGCAVQPDVFNQMNGWHEKNIKPFGTPSGANASRHPSKKIAEIIDALEPLPPTDPKIVPLTTDLMKTFVEEMPWIPMFGTSKFVPTVNYYWTGFPTAKDPYFGPWWWWSNFPIVLHKIQPTGKV